MVLIFSLCVQPSFVFADEAHYIYDDAGRLVRVVKGIEVFTYNYDEVGNLISIKRDTASINPPILQSIDPDVFPVGSKILTVLSGQNLGTTKDVKSDSSFLSIAVVSVTDTEIKAEMKVSSAAQAGPVTFTVVTLYGSASIQAAISSSPLILSPDRLSLIGGNNGTITASLSPPVGKDVAIALKNSNPLIVFAPKSLVIPSSGTATFQVNPLIAGTSAVTSGDARVDVFVIGGDITATSLPVSVYLDALSGGNASITASSVSVYLDSQSGGASIIQSLPVSVYLDMTVNGNAITAALPVSVYLDSQSGGASIIQSLPVSVYLDTTVNGNAITATSLPVSVQITSP